jgi:general secretion pathway protein F
MIEPTGKMRPATLDDLAALNREMAALVRAGLPVEESLGQMAKEYGHGELAGRLAREMSGGKSLAEAVAAQGDALPPVYRAVVEAGLRSGRLAAALEGFADASARVADLRRITAQAAVYPLIVMAMAWIMLLTVATLVMPGYDWLDLGDRLWISPLVVSPGTAVKWMVAIPAAMFLGAIVWWRRSKSALAESRTSRWMRWVPGAGRAERISGHASFADMLRLLLTCKVPLVEALPLAAGTSGSAGLRDAAQRLSSQLAAGQALTLQSDDMRRIPPLVRAALLGHVSEEGLLAALARAAGVYRERAAAWVARMSVITPVAATLLVGTLVVGVYAALIFQPYVAALIEAASWE